MTNLAKLDNSISNTNNINAFPVDANIELNAEDFLQKTLNALHTGATQNYSADYITNQIHTLITENPHTAKTLKFPNNYLEIKQKIVGPWLDKAVNGDEKKANLNLEKNILPKKQLGELVKNKVSLTSLPQALQTKLKEKLVEKIIAQGIKKECSADEITNKIFKTLPSDLKTDDNHTLLTKYIDDSLNQVAFKGADDLSKQGEEFLKNYEAFSPILYDNDGGKNTTIGYGHLVHTGKIDNRESEKPFKKGLTKEDADKLFSKDIRKYIAIVNKNITVPISQNQFDALVSLTYNLGYLPSTLADKINAGKIDSTEVKNIFLKYTYSKHKFVQGLQNRRTDEVELFLSNDYVRNH